MKVQSIAVAELVNDPANVRQHSARNLDAIKGSLARFGQQKPIVVGPDGVVVAGNGTLEAAKSLGWQKIDAVKTGLKGSDRTAFAIADNRTSELAEWDDAALAEQLSALAIDDEELLAAAGFDEAELEKLVSETTGMEDIVEDEAPEPPADPVTKTGDLWQLGEHRVLCGDSTKAEDVERLMGGEKADVVFTDPPYSSGGFQESGKSAGSIGARGGVKIETDNLSTRGYLALMDRVIGNLRDAHTLFVFCDWKMWASNCDIAEAKGYRVRNMIVWDKERMGMGMPFRNQHELCLFASKIAGKIGNGKTPNVLRQARDHEAKHATPKPVSLISRMLLQVPSALVADPFIGGGSTLIAAEQLGRKCYGIEISPAYCDVVVERWQNLTGKKAKRVANGKAA